MQIRFRKLFFIGVLFCAPVLFASCDDEDRGAFLAKSLDFYRAFKVEKPPILKALAINNFEKFYELIADPATDINFMCDDRSLLHFVCYRYNDSNGLGLLQALLKREDLKIDQKGTGSGDCGTTALGVLVGSLKYRIDNSFDGQIKKPKSLLMIKALLERGACLKSMSQQTKDQIPPSWLDEQSLNIKLNEMINQSEH
jgi:hypothetical protein